MRLRRPIRKIFDVLLQVLDDGRLTDGQGRTVDFKNTILIMTSNLGSQFLVNEDMDADAKKKAVMDAVHMNFKPEFLNRLDDIVMFHPLTREELGGIVDIQVAGVAQRLTHAASRWTSPTRLANGWPTPVTTRLMALVRCAAWYRPKWATSWPVCRRPARSTTVTPALLTRPAANIWSSPLGRATRSSPTIRT